MTTELIILAIGTVLTILSMLGGIKINKQSTAIFGFGPKSLVTLGLIGIGLIIYGGYSYGTFNQQVQIERYATESKLEVDYPVEEVQITSPIDGEDIQCRVLTMGVYPEGHTKDIWVLLQPSDSLFYPQSDYTNTSYKRNGEWQVISRFGGSKGEKYNIIAYEADSAASQYFASIIEEWKNNLSYPGLTKEELPESVNKVDRISVSLEENCRGVF